MRHETDAVRPADWKDPDKVARYHHNRQTRNLGKHLTKDEKDIRIAQMMASLNRLRIPKPPPDPIISDWF